MLSILNSKIDMSGTAIISITDKGSEPIKFSNPVGALLALQFNDEDERGNYERGAPLNPNAISWEQADEIVSFVMRCKNSFDLLIVQCEAGISRSAGCAAAISKYLYNTDDFIFGSPQYCPNMTVYKRVLKAFMNTEFNK